MQTAPPQNNYLAGHAAGEGIETVYADDSLLVFNKPAGLLSVPGRGEDKQDCLSRRVQQHHPDALVVHRLDMATSGLMLMARGAEMQRALSRLFENREVHKRYVAVVDGLMHENQPAPQNPGEWALIDLPIAVDWPRRPLRIIDREHGKPSQTRCVAWVLAMPRTAHGLSLSLSPAAHTSCACICRHWATRFLATSCMRLQKCRPGHHACCCMRPCLPLAILKKAGPCVLPASPAFSKAQIHSTQMALALPSGA